LLLLVMAVMGACATAPPRAAVVAEADSAASLGRLPPPPTPGVAEAMLNAAIDAMRGGEPGTAAVLLDAIVRGDHLTERGRANVYWLLAHAHRAAGDEAPMLDAFGSFLLASAVLEVNGEAREDLRAREVAARSVLVAHRVASEPRLGKSPDAAIPVEDVRDPAGIVAEMSCGGRRSYQEGAVSQVRGVHGPLESRQLTCTHDGSSLVLWFDLSSVAAD
jgi:hypothetical protein